MSRIWCVEPAHIELLQGHDRPFTELVNSLLVRQAREGGLPDAALRLNLNTLAPDGGVDAAVDQAAPCEKDSTGYLAVRTCWQYKACSTRHIQPSKGEKGGQQAGLAHEINKPEVKRLITEGYGYRFCIADELTPDRLAEWEGWLLEEARKINANAPAPIVLTASRLAIWASRYPGLIRSLRNDLGSFRDLKTWGQEIRYLTDKYFPVPAWSDHLRQLRQFADFRISPLRAVLPVSGEAGVGKTRCVYEALTADLANQAVVVYTTNESEAEALVSRLSADPGVQALVVADECGLEVASRLDRLLRAHGDRLRVIAIDNQLQSGQTSLGELRLSRLSVWDVEEILKLNFPSLLSDRRRAFALLSEGFVRLAVDLCENERLIPESGTIDGRLIEHFQRHYLACRLNDKQYTAVLIVSLASRVGFRGDVAPQLENLCGVCGALGISAPEVVAIAHQLKQSPGFIAVGERYL